MIISHFVSLRNCDETSKGIILIKINSLLDYAERHALISPLSLENDRIAESLAEDLRDQSLPLCF